MKSKTQKAVDALILSRSRVCVWRERPAHEWAKRLPRVLTIRAAARRYGLDPAGVARALKRRLQEKRCDECGQVIR